MQLYIFVHTRVHLSLALIALQRTLYVTIHTAIILLYKIIYVCVCEVYYDDDTFVMKSNNNRYIMIHISSSNSL